MYKFFGTVNFFYVAPAVPDSCLPIGMQQDQSETKLVPMQPGEAYLKKQVVDETIAQVLLLILSSILMYFNTR